MDDLKPCPFCGGEGKMGYVRDGLRVHCRLCFASGPSAFHGRTEDASTQERAIDAWNARTSEPDTIKALQAQLAAARNKALEDAARMVDCACECREAVLTANTRVERWTACGRDPCGALDAAAIRALIDKPGTKP